MSFDIFLVASDATPENPGEFVILVDESLAAAGVRIGPDGANAIASDGEEFEIFAGEGSVMFSLRGSSPGICDAIYELADQGKMFVVAANGGKAKRTANNHGAPPDDFLPIEDVADARMLGERIAADG